MESTPPTCRRLRLAPFSLATFAALAILPAQGLSWTQLQPPQAPPVRGWSAMAFDAARQQVVLHGGYNNTELGDTWLWDGLTWTAPVGAAMPTRRFHGLAYDEARQRVVLYGGQSAGTYPTTTATWNGTSWTAATTAVHPGGRSKHAMAYDAARQRVVLYGGAIPVGDTATWEWDGSAWSVQNVAVNPQVRNEHAMAYDAARQRIVLYGGQFGPAQGFAYANDTWAWNGSAWQQVATAHAPSAQRYPARCMAYDASRQQIVLFAGNVAVQDTWSFDGADWTQLTTAPTPAGRSDHVLAYDAARQTLVLFGGSTTTGYRNDTWVSSLIATATAYGAGCGSPALDLAPDPNGRPVLGQIGRLTITNAPSVTAIAAGWQQDWFGSTPLPMSLASFGMPGCDLLQSAEFLGLGAAAAGPSTFACAYPLANVPAILGHRLHLQAYSVAPGQNALQLIVSNGVTWVFGAM